MLVYPMSSQSVAMTSFTPHACSLYTATTTVSMQFESIILYTDILAWVGSKQTAWPWSPVGNLTLSDPDRKTYQTTLAIASLLGCRSIIRVGNRN